MSTRTRSVRIGALTAVLLASPAAIAQPAPAKTRVVKLPWIRAGVAWADARGSADLDVSTRSARIAGQGQTEAEVGGNSVLLEVVSGVRITQRRLQIVIGPQLLTTVLAPHDAASTRELDLLRIRPGAVSMTSLGLMLEFQFGGRFGWDLGGGLGHVWMSTHAFAATDGSDGSVRLTSSRGPVASFHTGPAWRFDEWQVGAKLRWVGAAARNYMEGASVRLWAVGLDVGRTF
jgi:hypothetical protein